MEDIAEVSFEIKKDNKRTVEEMKMRQNQKSSKTTKLKHRTLSTETEKNELKLLEKENPFNNRIKMNDKGTLQKTVITRN